MKEETYNLKYKQEIERYKEVVDIHVLPDIFHYWSGKYLLPIIQTFGFKTLDSIYVYYLSEYCMRHPDREVRFVSIGAGNCEPEVNIAKSLKALGLENFTFNCLDINESMLNRGKDLAREGKVLHLMDFSIVDLNSWEESEKYDVILAFQCLHHFVELEVIFSNINKNLDDEGVFITHDMIGRNGHMRWPEAREVIDELWSELPAKYKFNHQLNRQEETFMDWDCSVEGFEGIRAQDIMPLLCQSFKFELFIYWGGIMDIFIDRGFGHNFDRTNSWDRSFIDKVEFINREKILDRKITPTQTISVMQKKEPKRKFHLYGISPIECIRQA